MKRCRVVLFTATLAAAVLSGCEEEESPPTWTHPEGGPAWTDTQIRELAREEKALAEGEEIFHALCNYCHLGPDMPFGEGPANLFDGTWVHGETPLAIARTVAEGIVEKGMEPQAEYLSGKEIAQVVAYLLANQPADDVTEEN